MVQTITHMIHQRLEGLELSKDKWVDIMPSVLKQYTNTSHSTTEIKPHEANKQDNHFGVWLYICIVKRLKS